ncbi:MAG: hypothetical protein ACLQJR_34225 [Stellaceae bacterium]
MVKLFKRRQPKGADTVKLHVSLSQRSTRETVGLPGSGLHYTTPIKPYATAPVPHPGAPQLLSQDPSPRWHRILVPLLLAALLMAAFLAAALN